MNHRHESSHAQKKKKQLLVLKIPDHEIMFPAAWTVEHYSISAEPHQSGVKQRCAAAFTSLLFITDQHRGETRAERSQDFSDLLEPLLCLITPSSSAKGCGPPVMDRLSFPNPP